MNSDSEASDSADSHEKFLRLWTRHEPELRAFVRSCCPRAQEVDVGEHLSANLEGADNGCLARHLASIVMTQLVELFLKNLSYPDFRWCSHLLHILKIDSVFIHI